VHPGQIAIINETFTPMPEEIARARAILDALERAEGHGAVELDGEMLDEASRKLALQVTARARAAGLGRAPA
jgi:citrate lyase subunit beta/citryl-CoA lyase